MSACSTNCRRDARRSKRILRASRIWPASGTASSREVEAGHQAYIVYPVIEESKLELKAATEEFERLGA